MSTTQYIFHDLPNFLVSNKYFYNFIIYSLKKIQNMNDNLLFVEQMKIQNCIMPIMGGIISLYDETITKVGTWSILCGYGHEYEH